MIHHLSRWLEDQKSVPATHITFFSMWLRHSAIRLQCGFSFVIDYTYWARVTQATWAFWQIVLDLKKHQLLNTEAYRKVNYDTQHIFQVVFWPFVRKVFQISSSKCFSNVHSKHLGWDLDINLSKLAKENKIADLIQTLDSYKFSYYAIFCLCSTLIISLPLFCSLRVCV